MRERIIVGVIGTVYGVQGWLKVTSLTEPAENILTYRPWQIKLKAGWKTVTITASRIHHHKVIVQLPGCNDREEARRYTGSEIAIWSEQLKPLSVGEFYWHDLVGLEVVTLTGVSLGVIDHLLETGANDVLVVKGDQERLLPYLPGQVVIKVDLANRIMQVDWDPEF